MEFHFTVISIADKITNLHFTIIATTNFNFNNFTTNCCKVMERIINSEMLNFLVREFNY